MFKLRVMAIFELERLAILMFCAIMGCASHPPKTMSNGILQGIVVIGPLRPGPVRIDEKEPEPPAGLFASHHIAILSEDAGATIKEVPLDSKGNYRVELPPGNYLVDFRPHDIGMRRSPPSPVTVQSGKTSTLNLNIDTGMR